MKYLGLHGGGVLLSWWLALSLTHTHTQKMEMVEKVALPLLLPNPPPPSPSPSPSSSSKPNSVGMTSIPPIPPINTLIHDLNSNSSSRHRISLGKSLDPNRGKPWSPHRLSPTGQQILHTLSHSNSLHLDLELDLDHVLRPLLLSDHPHPASDILGIIKALGFSNKCDLALAVFHWVRTNNSNTNLFSSSAIPVIIKILGKAGRVSSAASLLLALQNDGVHIDVYAYTCLINAYSSSGRYRDAVNLFNKMQQDGCNPTLITYNVVLNVYGKMGMPWSNVTALVEAMRSRGVAPDLYTYNTLISCK